MVPSLPLLSCELSVSVKENPDRKIKKKLKKKKSKNNETFDETLNSIVHLCKRIIYAYLILYTYEL